MRVLDLTAASSSPDETGTIRATSTGATASLLTPDRSTRSQDDGNATILPLNDDHNIRCSTQAEELRAKSSYSWIAYVIPTTP